MHKFVSSDPFYSEKTASKVIASYYHHGHPVADSLDAAANCPFHIGMAVFTRLHPNEWTDTRSIASHKDQQYPLCHRVSGPPDPNPLAQPRVGGSTAIPRIQVLRVCRHFQRSCERRHH